MPTSSASSVTHNSPASLFGFDTAKASLGLVGLTLATATAAALSILGSIQLLGANKSAVLEISYPLFVALFPVLLFKGQLPPPVIIGGIFIFYRFGDHRPRQMTGSGRRHCPYEPQHAGGKRKVRP
jgi:drug/metabolite transporter (DMT)-like permease